MNFNDLIKDPLWPAHYHYTFDDSLNSHELFGSFREVNEGIENMSISQNRPLFPQTVSEEAQNNKEVFSEEELLSDEDEDGISESDIPKMEDSMDEEYQDEMEFVQETPCRKRHRDRSSSSKNTLERGKYKILDEETKKNIVKETESHPIIDVSRKYGISVNNICRWRKRCHRRMGAGRKVTDTQMEQKLLGWIQTQTGVISRKAVQQKAREFTNMVGFKASKGWFERFFKRNKLAQSQNLEILNSTCYKRQLKTKNVVPKFESDLPTAKDSHNESVETIREE